MKRLMGVLGGAAASTAAFARSALAGDYPPSPTRSPTVLPDVIHRADPGTAFTGANLTVGFEVLGGLIVVGAVALFVARRRATRSGS